MDLKTGLVEEISTATGRSITSSEIVFETFEGRPVNVELRFSSLAPGLGLRRAWLSAALKIEGRLRAYFSPELFNRWRAYDEAMVSFLYLAGLEGRINKVRQEAEREGRAEPLRRSTGGFDAHWVRSFLDGISIPDSTKGGIRSMLLDDLRTQRRLGFLQLEGVLLDKEAAFTKRLLAAEPRGFSTTRRDLINDLLP